MQVVSVTPAQYFSKKRGLANGVVYAVGGLGGTVISFAMDGLLSRLGPAWTFRVIGFVTLATGLPAAWLIRERAPIRSTAFVDWYALPPLLSLGFLGMSVTDADATTKNRSLLRDPKFIILFLAGALATFPL